MMPTLICRRADRKITVHGSRITDALIKITRRQPTTAPGSRTSRTWAPEAVGKCGWCDHYDALRCRRLGRASEGEGEDWGTVRCMLDGSLSLLGISGISRLACMHYCMRLRSGSGLVGGPARADDRLTGDLLVGRRRSAAARTSEDEQVNVSLPREAAGQISGLRPNWALWSPSGTEGTQGGPGRAGGGPEREGRERKGGLGKSQGRTQATEGNAWIARPWARCLHCLHALLGCAPGCGCGVRRARIGGAEATQATAPASVAPRSWPAPRQLASSWSSDAARPSVGLAGAAGRGGAGRGVAAPERAPSPASSPALASPAPLLAVLARACLGGFCACACVCLCHQLPGPAPSAQRKAERGKRAGHAERREQSQRERQAKAGDRLRRADSGYTGPSSARGQGLVRAAPLRSSALLCAPLRLLCLRRLVIDILELIRWG